MTWVWQIMELENGYDCIGEYKNEIGELSGEV